MLAPWERFRFYVHEAAFLCAFGFYVKVVCVYLLRVPLCHLSRDVSTIMPTATVCVLMEWMWAWKCVCCCWLLIFVHEYGWAVPVLHVKNPAATCVVTNHPQIHTHTHPPNGFHTVYGQEWGTTWIWILWKHREEKHERGRDFWLFRDLSSLYVLFSSLLDIDVLRPEALMFIDWNKLFFNSLGKIE